MPDGGASSAAALLGSAAHMNGTAMATRHLRLVTLDTDLVAMHGARCMDGSPGGFYYAPATSSANATRLVVHIEGGGECRSARACATWAFHSGSSMTWPPLRPLPGALRNVWPGSPMDPSPIANPDFYDWAKVFVPYCSADLHAGMGFERSAPLGGWYFAGHNLLAGALAQLRRLHPTTVGVSPSHVLVTGSSAGGIGALIHADWFVAQWPRATLKVSPEAGLFYPPIASVRDATQQRQTDPAAMAMLNEWKPYLHTGCAAAHNSSVAVCSNAHRLLRHIKAPLFLRENLFDIAKLANCGLDVHSKLRAPAIEYLQHWGRATRATIESLRSRPSNGFFAPSCLAHASNLRFSSSPLVGGMKLLDAMHAWYFHADGASAQYAIDSCGDLPCTNDTAVGRLAEDRCPVLDSLRECHARCRLNRRRRRIRLGLNPRLPGHNVCQLADDESVGAAAERAAGDAAPAAEAEANREITGRTAGGSASAETWRDTEEDHAPAEALPLEGGDGRVAHVGLEEVGGGGGSRGPHIPPRLKRRRRARTAGRRRAHTQGQGSRHGGEEAQAQSLQHGRPWNQRLERRAHE